MKKAILIILMGITLISCTERGRLERREERIEGRWYFDKAFYKDYDAIFRNNLKEEYRGDEVIFYHDGVAEYYDFSMDEYFEGHWVLTLHKFENHDGSERIYTLDMEFLDHIHRERFYFYSDATKIGFNNLNLEVEDEYGWYDFRLNKIE